MPTPTSLPSSFTAGDVLTAANMNNIRGAFRILQVVQSAKTDTSTMSGSTFTNIPGLSVTITPYSNTSKFLLLTQVNYGSNGQPVMMRFSGGNSGNYVGDAAGNRIRTAIDADGESLVSMLNIMFFYLDSPATASAITYTVQARVGNANTFYINRSNTDTDDNTFQRAASNLVVLEVSA